MLANRSFSLQQCVYLYPRGPKVSAPESNEAHRAHEFLFHLVQAELWRESVEQSSVYFPPTYEQDGFTHGTANPQKLLQVANHFYQDTVGDWLCLRMTIDSLAQSGVDVVFEGVAAVGDQPADFGNTGDELFPHLQGGIHPDAVLKVHPVKRGAAGEFLNVDGVT